MDVMLHLQSYQRRNYCKILEPLKSTAYSTTVQCSPVIAFFNNSLYIHNPARNELKIYQVILKYCRTLFTRLSFPESCIYLIKCKQYPVLAFLETSVLTATAMHLSPVLKSLPMQKHFSLHSVKKRCEP